MITSRKGTNNELYRDLFARASEILSGYERTQTFDSSKTYYFKDSNTKEFIECTFTGSEDEQIYQFANALTEYNYLYVETAKGKVDGFVPELGITTLEEYYNWLPDIKSVIKVDKDGKEVQVPTIFTKLPLDEPYFEINANTRAINIPAEFKKNGIAVQGDDLAEVVYFKIDRYFDAMDLNNTEIFIEWETPKGKDGTITKSISDIYLKDIESEPGKLIFGWAISDAITKDSGTLKFAVRFIQWVDGEDSKKQILYSFNTLTAQATIAPNLGLNLEKDSYTIDNANDRLLERIEPGEVVGGAQAMTPYFLTDIVVLEDGYDLYNTEGEFDPENGSYTLQVVATAKDTGAVSYVWKRADLNKYNISNESWVEILESNKVKMFELSESELEDVNYDLRQNREKGHIYHTFNGTSYNLLPEDYYNLKEVEEYEYGLAIPKIYEQRAYLEVTEYGQYRAEARNRIFNSLTKNNSKVATFKRPAAIKMINEGQTVDKHIINETSAILTPKFEDSVGKLEYQWYRTPEGDKEVLKYNTIVDLPQGTQMSCNADTIRIAFDDETIWTVNDPENYPDDYVYHIHSYAPSNAVKYTWTAVRGAHELDMVANTQKWDVDPVNNSNHVGSDERGSYVISTLFAAMIVDDVWTNIADYQSDLAFGKKGNTIMLEWYDNNGDKIKTDNFNVEYYKSNNFTPLIQVEPVMSADAQTDTLIAKDPGFYQLKITRIRNNDSTENTSMEYRVTHAPAIPTPAEGTYDGQKLVFVSDLLAGDSLKVNWDITGDADEFYVIWKLYRKDKSEDLTIVTQKMLGNIQTANFNPTDPLYADIFKNNNEDVEGLYYAVFATKLNGVLSTYSDRPTPETMFFVSGSSI